MLQIRATVTAGLNRLALPWPIDILVVPGPSLALRLWYAPGLFVPAFRTHHLHLVPFGSKHWNERLIFRDHLRRNSEIAKEYAELKQRLAEQYKFDREACTEAKGPFIQRILQSVM